MQFGRLSGAGIAVLGALLLLLQFSFFLNSSQSLNRPTEEHRDFGEHDLRTGRMHQLPGILGTVLLISGLAVFFLARTEDEPPQEKAVK